MMLIKKGLEFYIRTSLHVAICFVTLSMVITLPYLEPFVDWPFYIMQFCLVVVSYNLTKYYPLILARKPFKYRGFILIMSSLLILIALSLLAFETTEYWLIVALLVLLNLVYAFPLLFNKKIREFVYLKTPVVAISWVLLLLSFFWSAHGFANTVQGLNYIDFEDHMYLGITLLCFMIAYCIPFEIRDIEDDKIHLITLPQKIGVTYTKIIGYLSAFFFFVLQLMYQPIIDSNTSETVIITVLLLLFIYLSDKIKSSYFVSFAVEGLPIIWLLLKVCC